MIAIKFPREDLKDDPDLVDWLAKAESRRDWKDLRAFLVRQLVPHGDEPSPYKCWYTEIQQTDKNAQDIEHFWPKGSGKPLSTAKKQMIEDELSFQFFQEAEAQPYPWLEKDHRNYRLATALANRFTGKRDYFPLALNSPRLATGELPWEKEVYPLLLDPAEPQDAALLTVVPNGQIEPITVTVDDLPRAAYNDLAANWRQDGFNYLRAKISIHIYQLNDSGLVQLRKEKYEETITKLEELERQIDSAYSGTNYLIDKLKKMGAVDQALALTVRSAVEDFKFRSQHPGMTPIIDEIQSHWQDFFDRYNSSWEL